MTYLSRWIFSFETDLNLAPQSEHEWSIDEWYDRTCLRTIEYSLNFFEKKKSFHESKCVLLMHLPFYNVHSNKIHRLDERERDS